MTTQEITLNQDSDDGLYTQLLRGRYVTSIEGSIITLDDGTELHIYGNEGCGGCSSGWYWLEETFKQGTRKARIMSAYVAYDEDDTDEEAPSVYTIFVMVDGNPTQLPLATVRGDNGNGHYGTGFTLTATIQKPPTVTATVTSRDIINALVDGQTPSDVPDIRNREDLLNAVVYTLQQRRGASTLLCASPGQRPSFSASWPLFSTETAAPTMWAHGMASTKHSSSGLPTWREAYPSSCATYPTERKATWRNYATSQNECAPPRSLSRPSSPATT